MATAALTAPPDTGPSDHELVDAVRAGDDDAFGALYTRHHAHVSALVGGMVRDRARSEDIVQDAFVSALKRMRATDSDIHFRAWISEIARNASIDHFRRRSRAREVSIDSDGGLPASDARQMGTMPAPDQAALGRERFGHLRGALDELTDTHQRVIVLRELEGHSYHEIGRLMDLTPAGVESTLFRARRRLESEYEALDTGERCRTVQRAIGAMGEGNASRREAGRVRRHVLRCSTCARHARLQGVDTSGRLARLAALLPLPALLERRGGAPLDGLRNAFASGPASAARESAAAAPTAWDQAGPTAGKALAVMAAAFTIGHGPVASNSLVGPGHHRDTPSAARTATASALPSPATRSSTVRPASRPARSGRGPASGSAVTTPRAAAATSTGGSSTRPSIRPARPAAPRPRPSAPAPAAAPGPARSSQASQSASGTSGTSASGVPDRHTATPVPTPVPASPVQQVIDGVERALPEQVNVPGTQQPIVRPREVVEGVDATLRGLTGR